MAFGMSFSGSGGSGRNDAGPQAAAIIAAVSSALAAAGDIESSAIVVSMADDVLVLSGEAVSDHDRNRAVEVAASVVGNCIRNRIWIRSR